MAKDKEPPKPPMTPRERKIAAGKANLLKHKAKNFEKGNNANPKGRGKGVKNRSTILRELLGLTFKQKNPLTGKIEARPNPLNPDEKRITVEQAVDIALINKALSGNVEAIKEIKDTIHGKMKDITEITGKDSGPIQTTSVPATIEEAELFYKSLLVDKP